MSREEPPRPDRRIVLMLVLLPVWLVVSSGIGLWMWYEGQRKVDEPVKFTTPVAAGPLAEDVRKLVEVVGPRNVSTAGGAQGLTRAAAMIEGSLGPGNAGYRIDKWLAPETPSGRWPVIVAMLPGDERAPLWVVTAYDSRGGGVEANASGVASVLAAAQAMAGEKPGRPVNFIFLPHGADEDGPLLPQLDAFSRRTGEGEVVLVVEAMGARDGLMISSRDAELLAGGVFEKHGTIVGAEAICLEDDLDLSALLFELGEPAVRVATRRVVGPDEADDEMPVAEVHAAATEALVGLIRAVAK